MRKIQSQSQVKRSYGPPGYMSESYLHSRIQNQRGGGTTTGTIDMDLITTGRSAAARTLASQLAEALRDKFQQMGPQTIRLDELRQSCMEDSGMEVPMNALREALAHLEKDGVVRTSRQATVQILS